MQMLHVRHVALKRSAISKSRLRRRRRDKRSSVFLRKQNHEKQSFFLLLVILSMRLFAPTRTIWVRDRSSHWWDGIASSFTPHDWLENFRMSQTTFTYLCSKLKSSIGKQDTAMRRAIPTDKCVALTLWFLATGGDYRTIGHLFGVSKSTICVVSKEVCHAIVELLLSKYINIPSGSALKECINGFCSDHGFPQSVGAIDGTHIPVVSPRECPADYYTRKGWHSMIMQGMVDNRGLFTDVYVGRLGRVHDACVFANSTIIIISERTIQNSLP